MREQIAFTIQSVTLFLLSIFLAVISQYLTKYFQKLLRFPKKAGFEFGQICQTQTNSKDPNSIRV